jgi:hypothetical protein
MPHTAACLFPAVAALERPCLCPSCTHCTPAAASMQNGMNAWRACVPMHVANFDLKRWRVHALTPVESHVLGLFGLDENFLRPSPSLRCCLCMQLQRWGVLQVRLTEQCSATCRARWSVPVLCEGTK